MTYKTANDILKSYVVLMIQGTSAFVIDIFSGKDENLLKWLIFKVTRELLGSGVNLAKVWLPKNHFILKPLEKVGFIQEEEPLGIVPTGRCFHSALDFGLTAKNIFYTMADGDLF
jgi:hypothetical protein